MLLQVAMIFYANNCQTRSNFKIQAGTACGKWTNLAVLARNKDKVRVLKNNRCYNSEKEKKLEVKNCIFLFRKNEEYLKLRNKI